MSVTCDNLAREPVLKKKDFYSFLIILLRGEWAK